MFSAIRKLCFEWFGRHKEEKKEKEISGNKRPWDHDDVPNINFPKRRRLTGPDLLIGPRLTSDDFLCPARDFVISNRMASNSLFYSMLKQEGKESGRTQATKENIISISDDDEDDADRCYLTNGATPKSFDPNCKETEVKEWFSVKPFTKREQFLNRSKPPPRVNESDGDVQIVKMVEQKNESAVPRLFTPYRRVAVMERRRENSMQPRTNSIPFKSRSSPHIPLSAEKGSATRKISVNESFRLEEKKKYFELLQKFTHVPITSPPTIGHLRPNVNSEKRRFGLLENSRSCPSAIVECIDLTKVKDRVSSGDSSTSEIEVINHRGGNSLAAKMGEDKSEPVNEVIKKTKANPLYDPCWTADLTLIYNHKRMDRGRKEEQEKLKLQLCSRRSKELVQDFLEEQIQAHMRITEVALPEEIITLEDEELKLPKLTTQMERMVNAAFQRGNPTETLVECFNLRITRRDILTLSSNNWLNDEVINFYMNLLIERGKEAKYPTMYGFNTFFYPKLVQTGHASLKRWTRKVDVFAHDILIIPVHLGVHWCMAAVDFRKKSVRYYDSMGAPNRTCLEALLGYLEEEMLDKRKQKFSRTGWTAENVQNIPQQMNGSDCGMFACMYAEFLCRDVKINFSQADMPYFRRKMAYEILTKKLLL